MLSWILSFFKKTSTTNKEIPWEKLIPGEYVEVYLKSPEQVGIVSTTQSLTYQRLDQEDLATKKLKGFVVTQFSQGRKPFLIEFLEIDVVKKKGTGTQLVSYLLLREEIEKIKKLGDA
jgi:hypothetical protein